MKITEFKISQFKGIDSLEKENIGDVLNISGDNETGKTTIANAVLWCLFGKDIEGRSDFQIMPLNSENSIIENQKPSVFIRLDIEGREMTFKRVMKQKWVKKRGDESAIFDGSCTTDFFVDDVPLSKKDYGAKIALICSEDVFRCITLPTYLPSLEWKYMREIVVSVAGNVDYSETKAEFSELIDLLNNRTAEDYRKVIDLEKKGLKDEKDRIPEGIKASEKFLEGNENWKDLEKGIENYRKLIAEIDVKISDKTSVMSDFSKKLKLNSEKISKINTDQRSFVNAEIELESNRKSSLISDCIILNSDVIKLSSDISIIKGKIELNKNKIVQNVRIIQDISEERNENKTRWNEINESQFVRPENGVCGSCGQSIIVDEMQADVLKASFNANKSESLSGILLKNDPLINESEKLVIENESLKISIEIQEGDIKEIEHEISEKKNKRENLLSEAGLIDINTLENKAKKSAKYQEFDKEIIKLSNLQSPIINTSELQNEKLIFQNEIDLLNERLSKKATIDKAKINIEEYNERFNDLAQRIVKIEGIEFKIEKYESAIISKVEEKVNSLFTGVKFKMFEKQINGGIKQTCVILINGIPYASTNRGSQIQAGIHIINALCKHYNVTVPILLDNRESTIKIPDTKSQVFNMTVIPNQKLIIE